MLKVAKSAGQHSRQCRLMLRFGIVECLAHHLSLVTLPARLILSKKLSLDDVVEEKGTTDRCREQVN